MAEMQTIESAIKSMFEDFVRTGQIRKCDPCPICGETMIVFYDRKNHRDRSLPACPACGYKVTKGSPKTDKAKNAELVLKAHRQDAVKYFLNSSVFSDKGVIEHSFANYQVKTDKQKQAKQVAMNIVQDIMAGNPVSGMFTGTTGAGKTHLAISILYEFLERSKYQSKVMFLNYRELLSQTQLGFNDPDMRKKMAHIVSDQVKEADVVVIDDLGSEVGDDKNVVPASRYDVQLATSIYDSRANKATITTTNRSGTDLRKIYGSRIVSRTIEHSKGHTFDFRDMDDYRIKELQ